MCGRYAVSIPQDTMAELFEALPDNDLPETPNYNICPTMPVHTVRSEGGVRRLSAMRWGFLPHWYKSPGDGPLLFNARAESLAEKPAFREACRKRRCLIPVSGFYEWTTDAEGTRLPWYIRPAGDGALAFAGVWQDWQRGGETIRSCAIVTTAAAGSMREIHHRVPVLLGAQDWPLWLGERGHGAAVLMRAAPEGALRCHRVGPEVNASRASGAQLVAPL
ncbi:SOS response-associated peptidase [Salipiger abyssi]|uniref:SOS response-associated peptidase n=1 Tax=Salipiger abyssi TaxID=1250539 RepID=UPI004058A900